MLIPFPCVLRRVGLESPSVGSLVLKGFPSMPCVCLSVWKKSRQRKWAGRNSE